MVSGHWGVCGEGCPLQETVMEAKFCMTVAGGTVDKLPCAFPFSAGVGNEQISACLRWDFTL